MRSIQYIKTAEIKECPRCEGAARNIMSGLGSYIYCCRCGVESPRTGFIETSLSVWNDIIWREYINRSPADKETTNDN